MSETEIQRQSDDDRKKQVQKSIKLREGSGVAVTNLHEMLTIAAMMQKARLLPKGVENEGQAALLLMAGAEVGLGPMTTIRQLYLQPKSNRIEWTAEGALAQALRSKLILAHREWTTGSVENDDATAFFEVVRKDQPNNPVVVSFSADQAKVAGLWKKKTRQGNDSVWVTWAMEMLIATAKRRCLRLAVPDALGGYAIQGEAPGEEAVQRGDDLEDAPLAEPPKPQADPLMEAGRDIVDAEIAAPEAPQSAGIAEEEAQADVDEILGPPTGEGPDNDDRWLALRREAELRAEGDDQAQKDLINELEKVAEDVSLEAAEAALINHPVFGGALQQRIA